MLEQWSAQLPHTIDQLQQQANTCRQEASELRALAVTMPFDREHDLITAQAKLDQLTAQIEVMAQDQQQAA